jgi:biopolymer transport protein ExbB
MMAKIFKISDVMSSFIFISAGALFANLSYSQNISENTSTQQIGNSSAELVSNPYGLSALIDSSDVVTKIVLLILLVMSLISWFVIFSKIFTHQKIKKQSAQANALFWDSASLSEAANKLDENSPYRYIALSAVYAVKNHSGLKKNIPQLDWLQMNIQSAVDAAQNQTQFGLSFLATVGSTSPFVGLFGTVWGIYHALTAIGISGQASIDKVAGPVGEALIMTAIGLAVAIPAVLGYNVLVKKNKEIIDDIREFSEEVNGVLIGSNGQAV